jgi:hypothetical protein
MKLDIENTILINNFIEYINKFKNKIHNILHNRSTMLYKDYIKQINHNNIKHINDNNFTIKLNKTERDKYSTFRDSFIHCRRLITLSFYNNFQYIEFLDNIYNNFNNLININDIASLYDRMNQKLLHLPTTHFYDNDYSNYFINLNTHPNLVYYMTKEELIKNIKNTNKIKNILDDEIFNEIKNYLVEIIKKYDDDDYVESFSYIYPFIKEKKNMKTLETKNNNDMGHTTNPLEKKYLKYKLKYLKLKNKIIKL